MKESWGMYVIKPKVPWGMTPRELLELVGPDRAADQVRRNRVDPKS